MDFTLRLLLQLVLVSLVAASHYYSALSTFTHKGKNTDGTHRIDIRHRETFRGCWFQHSWGCHFGNCGSRTNKRRGTIDKQPAGYDRNWCEIETVSTRIVPSDKAFSLRESSCCWVQNRNPLSSWNLQTFLDFGTRSDTRRPNRSPDIGILPVLRTPQNCPRTYSLKFFDPDGDRIRCRYGNIRLLECTSCRLPAGFVVDQDSCTFTYRQGSSSSSSLVYGLEMVVEDFPRRGVALTYDDGSRSYRGPLPVRRKRALIYPTMMPTTTAAPWWWWQGTTTPAPSTAPWWWWQTTTAPTTTAAPWWWWQTTTAPTTARAPWWWWQAPTTAATTTTAAPTTPPWWWWWQTTTTPAPTTTTAPWRWWWQTTTTAAPTTTTTPWRWWWQTTTTAAPTTTTTPWRWWWQTTTTAAPTTVPWWLRTTRSTAYTGSTSPLSKLPLQFSFLVDNAVPTCQEGLYLPKLLPPTPANGARIQAEVGKEVEIRVRAQASYSTINNIVISGPVNITKHRSTQGDFIIRWTPNADELGEYFLICFAVEARSGYSIYQSEMRCVVTTVVEQIVKSNVICDETSMTVEIEKTSLDQFHEDSLRLNDPTNTLCSLQRNSNSTHVIAVIPLNACGTQLEEDEENLIFTNEITTVDSRQDVITRKHLLEVQVCCQYPKRGNVTLSFTVHRDNVTVWEKGFGEFTYNFEFYPDNQFRTMVDPNSYPLEYEIGSRIYMQIEATSQLNNTELFVESCSAAPYDNPNYSPKYEIIDNGCDEDPTVQRHTPDHRRQFRFSMEAFKFIGQHDQVYISCSVMMCEAGQPGTRCSQGCINSTQSGGHRVAKREAVTETSRHLVSQGPLRLRRSAERAESPAINLNVNLVFIAGCLLAAVGMISAVVMYKAKMSKVKYQPLPTAES